MPLGIPHSKFLGWSESDQDKALAFIRDRDSRCGGCGTRKEDWTRDPDVFVGWHETCPGCERLEQERANVPEGKLGVRYSLMPRAIAIKLMDQGEGQ